MMMMTSVHAYILPYAVQKVHMYTSIWSQSHDRLTTDIWTRKHWKGINAHKRLGELTVSRNSFVSPPLQSSPCNFTSDKTAMHVFRDVEHVSFTVETPHDLTVHI